MLTTLVLYSDSSSYFCSGLHGCKFTLPLLTFSLQGHCTEFANSHQFENHHCISPMLMTANCKEIGPYKPTGT